LAKAALHVDGWESTTNEHVINVLAVAGDNVYFLESFQTGSNWQGAGDQAALVQRVIGLYPGIFDAVFSDSTTCCRQMREVIAAANPDMASINDQAHAINLLASDLGKTSFFKNAIKDASVVAKYVGNHYRLTVAYRKVADKDNANEIAPAERLFKSAKRYPQPRATSFLYVRDLLAATARNFFPLRAIPETGGGVEELVRAQSTVAKEAQSAFLAVAQWQFAHKDCRCCPLPRRRVRVFTPL
jgi:Protein of unknown function (DUF 659)